MATAKACAPSSSGLCRCKRPAPVAEGADCAPQVRNLLSEKHTMLRAKLLFHLQTLAKARSLDLMFNMAQCELCNSCTPFVPLATRLLSRLQPSTVRSCAPPMPPRISVSEAVSPAAAPFTPAVADGRPEAYSRAPN